MTNSSANAPTSNDTMRKGGILILFLLFLFSCGGTQHDNSFTIEGDTGIPQGKVYIYGSDSRCDAVYITECDEEGYFRFTIPAKATLPLTLITPTMQYVPVFGEPGVRARIERDSTFSLGWSVEGGSAQALHDSISRVLDACRNTEKRYELIDSFIFRYPINDVNIEIIRRYMTEGTDIDDKAIRSRIGRLGGILQDHGFFAALKERTDNKKSNIKHRTLPSFTGTTIDSVEVTQHTYRDKYTLVTFWATWDRESRERMRMLSGIQDSIESKSFAMLNIALDYDSAAWRRFVTEDSIAGDNIIESQAFCSPIVKQFNIKSLPFTMLVNPYTRIQEYDIKMDGLATLIDSLTNKYDKAQEKKRAEEEKRKKKKNNKKE